MGDSVPFSARATMPPTLRDPTDVREHNLRLVLNLIREAGPLSRVDIARATQLSRSTVTNIVTDLLLTDLVRESGTVNSAVGRRPTLLEFDHDARLVLGVDMGATHLTVVALNLAGEVRALRHERLPVSRQPDQSLARMEALLVEVRDEAGEPASRVLGLGVAVPTPLEGEGLDRLSPVILPLWVGIDLKRELAAATDLPVFLDNDANLGALAESWWGHGREVSTLAYVKVATGVGCGLIVGGSIFRGEGGTAGEIGHTTIDPDGPPCRCGLSGCLEALTGAPALVRAVREARAAGRPSLLSPEALTVEAVVEAANAGDALAVEVIERAGRYLGIALANLLNLVNPGLIVLGGSVTGAGERLLTPLRRTVRQRTFSKSAAEATITTSRLGEDAIAIGAATLVIDQVFRTSERPVLQVLADRGR